MIFTIDTLGKKPETKKAVAEAPPIDPEELAELGRMSARLSPEQQPIDDDETML